MKKIVGICKQSEQGMSHPLLCRTDDGCLYWCKGWQAGVDALRKEWVCANLARKLNLPIADFEILECPLGLAKSWAEVQESSGQSPELLVRENMPFVFGSKSIRCVSDMHHESEVVNEALRVTKLRVALFDELIKNVDRTDGNSNVLIVTQTYKDFWIIDHNNAFSEEFTREEFVREHVFRQTYLEASVQERNELRHEFSSVLDSETLSAIWEEMPEEWRNEEFLGVSEEAVVAILRRRWDE